jgi:hypothetical protein
MGESLTLRRRVNEEGLRVVKFCHEVRNSEVGNDLALTFPRKEALAKHVPAAAVIRVGLALLGFTGLKGCVGG